MNLSDTSVIDRERNAYRDFRDALEVFRLQEQVESRYLNLIVTAEIMLAHASQRLGEPFPNLRYVLKPQSCASREGRPSLPIPVETASASV